MYEPGRTIVFLVQTPPPPSRHPPNTTTLPDGHMTSTPGNYLPTRNLPWLLIVRFCDGLFMSGRSVRFYSTYTSVRLSDCPSGRGISKLDRASPPIAVGKLQRRGRGA